MRISFLRTRLQDLRTAAEGDVGISLVPDVPKLFPAPAGWSSKYPGEPDRVCYEKDQWKFQAEYSGASILIRAAWPASLGALEDLIGSEAMPVGNTFTFEKTYEDLDDFAKAADSIKALFSRVTGA